MKRIIKFFRIALYAIVENKSRSFLTMLGIVIGIGSVILMISLGKAAENLILSSVQSLGSNVVFIQPGGGKQGGPPSVTSRDKLKYKDYLAMKRLNYIYDVTPVIPYEAQVTYQNYDEKAFVVGSSEGYLTAVGVTVDKGRFVDEKDVVSGSMVAVIGYKIADQFFADQDPVGKVIKIKKKDFRVIGVMARQGVKFFQDFDKRIVIPVSTMKQQIFGVDYVFTIIASVKGDMDQAIVDLRDFFRKRHNIKNPENDFDKDDFKILSQMEAVDTFKSVAWALTLFLAAIAAISLVVGGVGIMNIMLVSVSERTMEIGLRKAVGATNGDIMLQFLIEAIVITLFAGIIGVAFGIGSAFLLSLLIANYQEGWAFIVDINSVIVSFGFAVLIGLLFGIYPARNASKLNSIEALRFE